MGSIRRRGMTAGQGLTASKKTVSIPGGNERQYRSSRIRDKAPRKIKWGDDWKSGAEGRQIKKERRETKCSIEGIIGKVGLVDGG